MYDMSVVELETSYSAEYVVEDFLGQTTSGNMRFFIVYQGCQYKSKLYLINIVTEIVFLTHVIASVITKLTINQGDS